MHHGKARVLAAGLMAFAWTAAAQTFYGDKKYGEFYEEEKKWVEQEAKLPDFPKPENLIEFDAGAATSNRYYVDGSTLSVGGDGVVRYVLVIRTSGGATNVNFEAIRCDARERKLYATGRNDNSWAKARIREWQAIRPGSYQAILSNYFFCPNRVAIYKAEEGVDALKRGGHPELK